MEFVGEFSGVVCVETCWNVVFLHSACTCGWKCFALTWCLCLCMLLSHAVLYWPLLSILYIIMLCTFCVHRFSECMKSKLVEWTLTVANDPRCLWCGCKSTSLIWRAVDRGKEISQGMSRLKATCQRLVQIRVGVTSQKVLWPPTWSVNLQVLLFWVISLSRR